MNDMMVIALIREGHNTAFPTAAPGSAPPVEQAQTVAPGSAPSVEGNSHTGSAGALEKKSDARRHPKALASMLLVREHLAPMRKMSTILPVSEGNRHGEHHKTGGQLP